MPRFNISSGSHSNRWSITTNGQTAHSRMTGGPRALSGLALLGLLLLGSLPAGLAVSVADAKEQPPIAAVNPPTAPQMNRGYPPEMTGAKVETYKTVDDVELRAYIFHPVGRRDDERRPAIVFFFGGGWKAGSPGQFEPHCRYLAQRGIVAITADYRVSSRHGVKPQQCVADAKSAIRWVRQNAKRLGVDPKRIAAGGGSAGGHLAAATATLPDFDEAEEDHSISSKPNALVLFNPAVQLAPLKHFNPFSEEKLADLQQRTDGQAEKLSPVHHLRRGTPPTVIFHGTADTAVPYSTVEHFTALMKNGGNRCQLVTFEGRPHGFFNPGRGRDDASRQKSLADFRTTMRKTDQFLTSLKYLSPRPSADVPPHIASQLDVVYSRVGERELHLDIFHPRGGEGALPAVLVVHGGGWLKGDKEKFRPLAIELASRGFLAAAVEYRLGGEAKFPAAIHDCQAAVRYLRNHAGPLRVDPNRIGAVGGSAGGHLVGLLAAAADVPELQGPAEKYEQSSQIQAAIVLAGPLELAKGSVAERSRTVANSNANLWIGKTIDQAPDLYRLASATTHFDKRTPPILFMAGEHDQPQRNQPSRDQLKMLGVETGLVVVPEGKHGCWNRHPFFLPMIDDMHAFLAKHIGQ